MLIYKYLKSTGDTSFKERKAETIETLNIVVHSNLNDIIICTISPKAVMDNMSFLV